MDLAYLSKSPGIGGRIKDRPEDFVVEEILGVKEGEGPFLWVKVRKVGMTTLEVVRILSSGLGISPDHINYGGIKDKDAVTVQTFSVKGGDPQRVEEILGEAGVEVLGYWMMDRWIKPEDVVGNRFRVCVRDAEGDPQPILDELNGLFPNYFGPQRFGARGVNVDVGVLILKGRMEEALELLMGRRVRRPSDFMRRNWRILQLCLHSVQSQAFNLELSLRIEDDALGPMEGDYLCGRNPFGFADPSSEGKDFVVTPLVSRGVPMTRYKEAALDTLGLNPSDLSYDRGRLRLGRAWRVLLAPYVGMNVSDHVFSFSLGRGSYATSLMREIMKA